MSETKLRRTTERLLRMRPESRQWLDHQARVDQMEKTGSVALKKQLKAKDAPWWMKPQ